MGKPVGAFRTISRELPGNIPISINRVVSAPAMFLIRNFPGLVMFDSLVDIRLIGAYQYRFRNVVVDGKPSLSHFKNHIFLIRYNHTGSSFNTS